MSSPPPTLPLHRFGRTGAPRILWLHGWLGSGAEGDGLFAPWQRDFEIICPDLPGHGANPLLDFDLHRCLDGIASLAASCRWAAGYSLGGRLLMMSAARNPDSFRTLILESASLGYASPAERSARRDLDAQRASDLRQQGLDLFCRTWYAQPMWGGFRNFPPRNGDPNALATALEAFSTGCQPNQRPWLRSTTCRVLWLAGTRDPAYVSQAEDVRASSRAVVILADAGHNVHAQNPRDWHHAVRTFQSQQEQQQQ